MDQNQHNRDKNNTKALTKFHISSNPPRQGVGDKHFAKFRATAVQNPDNSTMTRLNSPRRTTAVPPENGKFSSKHMTDVANNYTRRMVSSFKLFMTIQPNIIAIFRRTKQFLEQYAKCLNARPNCPSKKLTKIKPLGQHGGQIGAVEKTCDKGTLSMYVSGSKRSRNKPEVEKAEGLELCELVTLPAQIMDIEACLESENRTPAIRMKRLPPISEPETPGSVVPQLSHENYPYHQPQALPNNLNAFPYPQQQGSTIGDTILVQGSMYCGNTSYIPPVCIGNCFSCATLPNSLLYHTERFSDHCLKRNCNSAQHFKDPYGWNTFPSDAKHSSYSKDASFENDQPDITIQNTGKCIINSLCHNARDNRPYYNVQGFEVAFYQSDPANIFERSIRLDFSTLGFLDPESFETEIDNKGNIFVSGNIFSTTSKLWISVQHCVNPDKIIIENPSAYYYTIEIPCQV